MSAYRLATAEEDERSRRELREGNRLAAEAARRLGIPVNPRVAAAVAAGTLR